MRKLGMNEEVILKLRELDWADFNEERRFREHQILIPDYEPLVPIKLEEPEPNDVQSLLDSIEDERLLHIMLATDSITLQILLLKIAGYSVLEISRKLELPEQTIYTRIRRLRGKIKKFME